MIVCLLCVVMIPGFRSEAAKKPSVVKKQTVFVHVKDSVLAAPVANEWIFIKNMPKKGKIKNIQCDNKKVEIIRDEYFYKNTLEITAMGRLKDGDKAKVSFTVVSGKKSYRLTTELIFKKYREPFSSLKIGSKKYTKTKSGIIEIDKKTIQGDSIRVTTKARKNAVVTEVLAIYMNGEELVQKTYRNGDNIDLADLKAIMISYEYKKPAGYAKSMIRGSFFKDIEDLFFADSCLIVFGKIQDFL